MKHWRKIELSNMKVSEGSSELPNGDYILNRYYQCSLCSSWSKDSNGIKHKDWCPVEIAKREEE